MKKLLFCLCALFFLHCAEVPDYGVLKVSASPTNGGVVQKDPSGPEYKDGTIVTLIAEAANGYKFVGWSGNVKEVGVSKTTIIVNGNDMVIANFVKIPNEPNNVSAMVNSSGIIVEWSSVSNATGYRIYRSTGSSGNYTQIGISAVNSYNDYAIQLGMTYYYKVSAYNGNVEGPQSNNPASATTPPNAPDGVSASINSAGDVIISWSSMSNATGYYIYRSTTFSGTYNKIGSSSTTPYTDNSGSPGTTYYYKVSAYNSGGEGPQSNYVDVTTRPSTPTGVKVTANSTTSITITWLSVPNATGYNIYRSTTSSGSYSNIGTSPTTSYTDNTGSPGTTYYYKVSAYNSGGESSLSDYDYVTTQLNAPIISGTTVNSATSVSISWSSVSNATGYRIYRSTSSSGNYSSIGTSSTTSYTDNSCTSGTTYYYRVAAYNSNGEGSQSSYVSVITQLGTPTGVTAVANSSSITISWSSVSGATGYNIYRSTSSSGSYSRLDYTSYISYTDTYVTSGTTYYYKVSAYNSNSESPQSTTVSARP